VEQQLAAGLGEGQISEFIEDDKVLAPEMIGHASRPARVSASSLLTRSTTLKKRPRVPLRMAARAMAMARHAYARSLTHLRARRSNDA
jgi:hypothetical protein